MSLLHVVKVFSLSTLAFIMGIFLMPILFKFLEKIKAFKTIRSDGSTPNFSRIHKKKSGTLTMGGIIFIVTEVIIIFGIRFLHLIFDIDALLVLDFLSRSETYLPLGALLFGGFVALIDDYMNCKRIGPKSGGMEMKLKLFIYTVISAVSAFWFYFKLEFSSIHVPFFGEFEMGLLYIPFFMIVFISTLFSVNETDGLDGLAGGAVFPILSVYSLIAFMQGKVDLATFGMVLVGSLFAFLWVNIPPAKIFMGDVGAVSLGMVIGIMAMLTNYSLLLPIIAFPIVVESLSVLIQLFYKKVFKKKKFESTPIHHHFQAKGMAEHTIVMRFWLVSFISAIFGFVIFLLDRIY